MTGNACDFGGGHRTRVPVPSPLPQAMPPGVLNRIRSDRATWPGVPTGADEAEGVAVDGVAADPSVLDTGAEPTYGDGVKRDRNIVDGLSDGREDRASHVTPAPVAEVVNYGQNPLQTWRNGVMNGAAAENARRARLSRWQEQRP